MYLQATEIEEYLIEKGAKELQSSEEDDMIVRLYRIIEHCHIVFTGSNAAGKSSCISYQSVYVDHVRP